MKKIVPFNNILTFNTDVCEITAISLEHNIEIDSDVISGEFYISGEYKMTDGQLEKEEFNFELPFDIALGSNYDNDSLIIDIDDFRYELIERNKLKVNIDLFIDGEILESINEKEPIVIDTLPNLEEISPRKEESFGVKESSRCLSEEDINKEEKIEINNEEENPEYDEPIQMPITEDLDLLNEMLENNKENVMKEEKNTNNNINTDISNPEVNIFNGFNEEERYVTYRVYRFLDTDNIDKILEKYNITKEELSKYNNLEDIKPGDKLIIPANDK